MAFLSRKFLEQRAEELHQELKFAREKETQLTRTCAEGQVQSLELEARLRILEEDKRMLSNEVGQIPGSSPCLTGGTWTFLEQRAEELHQELKFAREKETQLTRTCAEGQVQSLELEARLRILEEDKRMLSNEIVELQQKLKDSQQMHLLGKKQLEEELKEAEEKQTRTQQQFQEEQQKRAGTHKGKIAWCSPSVDNVNIVELQQKLKDSQQMHLLGKKQLEEELKEAEEKQTRTQQQFQEEQQKRTFLEQRAEELHQELKFAREKETQLTRTCAEGQVQSLELEARLRILEEDKRMLSNEIVELQQKLKDSQEMHLLGTKQLEEEVKEANEKQARAQQQFQEEQQKRMFLEQQAEELHQELKFAREKETQLTRTCAEGQAQSQELEARLRVLEEDKRTLSNEHLHCLKYNQTLSKQVLALQKDKDTLHEEHLQILKEVDILVRKNHERKLRHRAKLQRAKETLISEVEQRDVRLRRLEYEVQLLKMLREEVGARL
nr:coiled-coil domain-containing protein 30-like [Pogona vitticeps]